MDELDHHTDEIKPISADTRPEVNAEPHVDTSWVAIQTLGVLCVLCTVRTFRARCTQDMEGLGTGREEASRQSLDDDRAVAGVDSAGTGTAWMWTRLGFQMNGYAARIFYTGLA